MSQDAKVEDIRVHICERLLKCLTLNDDVGAEDWMTLISLLSIERAGRYEQIKRLSQEVVLLKKRVDELENGEVGE